MGPVLTWESLESSTYTMRAIVLVLLGAVAINAEAEADPVLYHHTGVHVPTALAGVHPFYHMFGKREAEPEAEADPLVYSSLVHHPVAGVHHVHPVYNHHVVPAVHPYYNMYGKREAEAEADPLLVRHTAVGHVAHVPTVHPVHHVAEVYTHPYHYNLFMFGKREAEAEAEADPVMLHHTVVHPVHASVYNHHMVPTVHHGVHHVAGVHPVHAVRGIYNGIYNTYPRTYWA